jgi:hypothetical protein
MDTKLFNTVFECQSVTEGLNVGFGSFYYGFLNEGLTYGNKSITIINDNGDIQIFNEILFDIMGERRTLTERLKIGSHMVIHSNFTKKTYVKKGSGRIVFVYDEEGNEIKRFRETEIKEDFDKFRDIVLLQKLFDL